ncbi:MAG: hypothetical protein PHR06_15250, partial [Candidatus Cloacimonetes bacterium]|nr:hypothetical protein [Candidatus Cloacimonadota bacterium]
ALYAYNNALNITPDDKDILYQKGRFLANSEKFQDSLEILDQLIQIDPEYRDGWRLRGFVLKKLGDNEEAFNSYKKAVYIDLLDQGYYLKRLEDFVKEMGWKDRMTAVYEDMLQEEEKNIEENLPLDRFEGGLYNSKIELLYKLGRDVEMKWAVEEANKEIEKFNQINDLYRIETINEYKLASILRDD